MVAAFSSGEIRALRTHESVGGVGAALWRRKIWIFLPTALAFLASLFIVNLLPTRYGGEARVLLENRETAYSRPDRDARASDPAIDPEAVASQVQVVMSKDLALKVVKEAGLMGREEFDPALKGSGMLGRVFVLLGLAPDPRSIPAEERVLETYYKRLLAYPLGKSRVIAIEFQSENSTLAAEVANRIAEEYLKREQGAKTQTSKVTSDWLDRAIEPLMKKVIEAEAKVEAFRASKGLFVSTSNNMTISSQQLSEMNTQLSNARSQQADLQARAKLIREAVKGGRVFDTSEINNNELVRRLLEQRAQLKAQIAFDERTLLPGHPRMKELVSQLNDLEGQVRSAAERAARAFENDAKAAGARVASLTSELDFQKKNAGIANESEVQLKALERDATALREQLNSYRNKFLDAAARSGENAQTADARIISKAFAQSEPVFPKKIPIVLLATLGTLVVCCALIASQHLMTLAGGDDASLAGLPYGAEQGNDGATPVSFGPKAASYPPEMAGASRPAWLAALPFAGLFRRRTDAATPSPLFDALGVANGHSPWVERSAPAPSAQPARAADPRPDMAALEEIVRELGLMSYHGRGKILAMHGLETGARTSLNAVRLARRMALDGSVIVIDLLGQGDFYARLLGQGSLGLGSFLDGIASFADVIHRDPRSRLHVIPAGEPLQGKVFGAGMRARLIRLVEALSQTYATIIIDAGMVGSSAEILTERADAIALITMREEESLFLRQSVERLEALRGAPVFILLDEASTARQPANDPGDPDRFGVA